MALNPWRLRLLDVFERVGTVRGVAGELLLSPSTVSQQFAVLEAETGVQVFERVGRSLHLTPYGRMLVERARDLRDHLDSIEAELRDAANGVIGVLRVGGFASSVEPILIETVRAIQRTHRRLSIEIHEIEPRESTTALHLGICDIIVTVDELDGSLLTPAIATVPLTTDPLIVVLPKGHPAARLDVIPLAELAEDRWALDVAGSYLGELIPRHCRLAGFEPIVSGRFSSSSVLLDHVRAGLSVAVLPEMAVTLHADLVLRPTSGLADRRIVAATRRANMGRPVVIEALKILRQVAALPVHLTS
jgi:DNA-binding transcriptional LysR family regulator